MSQCSIVVLKKLNLISKLKVAILNGNSFVANFVSYIYAKII